MLEDCKTCLRQLVQALSRLYESGLQLCHNCDSIHQKHGGVFCFVWTDCQKLLPKRGFLELKSGAFAQVSEQLLFKNRSKVRAPSMASRWI